MELSAAAISRRTAQAVRQSLPLPSGPAGSSRAGRPASRSRESSSKGGLPARSRASASTARSSAISRVTRSQMPSSAAVGGAGAGRAADSFGMAPFTVLSGEVGRRSSRLP